MWVTPHIASICRCGTSYSDLQSVPANNEAYTVFIPHNANRIFIDPETKAHVQTFEETIAQLKTITGEDLQITMTASPRMLVAIDGHLQFIDINTETPNKFLCLRNSCTSEMSAMFAVLAEKESDLIDLYTSLADLSKAVTLAPDRISKPTRLDSQRIRPVSESEIRQTKQDDIVGPNGVQREYISVKSYSQ